MRTVFGRSSGDGAQNNSVFIADPNPRIQMNFGAFGAQSQIDDDKRAPGVEFETVPSIGLDDLKLQKVDLLKVDAEGMEEHVLQGL